MQLQSSKKWGYGQKIRQTDQWKRIENPETDTQKNSQLYLKKEQEQSSWTKIVSLKYGVETKGNPLEIHFKKINPGTYLETVTKIKAQ